MLYLRVCWISLLCSHFAEEMVPAELSQGPGRSWWVSAHQMSMFTSPSLHKPYHSLLLGFLTCFLGTVLSLCCLYMHMVHDTAALLPPQPSADSSVPQHSFGEYASSSVCYNVEEEIKIDVVKVPNPCSLYLSYCKNCAVVHKAIKMLPQPLSLWGVVTDIRHKFYRIQIPSCVSSCPNCMLQCLLMASFFLTCSCRQRVSSSFFPMLFNFPSFVQVLACSLPPQLF